MNNEQWLIFTQKSVLIYLFLFLFCKIFLNYWFTISIFIDDWEYGRFEVLRILDVLVKLIQLSFAGWYTFEENILD